MRPSRQVAPAAEMSTSVNALTMNATLSTFAPTTSLVPSVSASHRRPGVKYLNGPGSSSPQWNVASSVMSARERSLSSLSAIRVITAEIRI